jgi:hypothetical protein
VVAASKPKRRDVTVYERLGVRRITNVTYLAAHDTLFFRPLIARAGAI